MVLRIDGWRVAASAAVCLAAAGAMSSALARDLRHPVPAVDIPMQPVADDALLTTGSTKLVWGGPLPPEPIPGEAPVYVPSQSAYPSRPQPQPQFTPALDPDADDLLADEPEPVEAFEAPRPLEPEPIDDAGMAERPLHAPFEAGEPEEELLAPGSEDLDTEISGAGTSGVRISGEPAAPPPLAAPVDIGDGEGVAGYAATLRADPWAGLTEVSPGAVPPPRERRSAPILEGRVGAERPSYAALDRRAPPRRAARPRPGWLLEQGRGALEDKTPTGYQPMPQSEALCRRALQRLGVGFVDATSIRPSRNCGIDYPVKVTDIAPGIAVRPAATLNCMAALRVAQWMDEEVKPAARWKLLKRPTVLINASSYRCSRIAGSRSISQHASGNALDVHGFKFSDGSIMEIEKKGFFEFRQKAFQKTVRESACRHFGTVLGPGYNEDHADHLHLDAKQRRRTVCK